MARLINVRVFLQATRELIDTEMSVPLGRRHRRGNSISAEEHVDDVLTLPRELSGAGGSSACGCAVAR